MRPHARKNSCAYCVLQWCAQPLNIWSNVQNAANSAAARAFATRRTIIHTTSTRRILINSAAYMLDE